MYINYFGQAHPTPSPPPPPNHISSQIHFNCSDREGKTELRKENRNPKGGRKGGEASKDNIWQTRAKCRSNLLLS